MTSVPSLLADRAREHPDALLVVGDGVSRTLAEMHERAERVAGALAALGVGEGDRVATILTNRIEHVDLIFGCARLGAIHVPVNVFLKGEFLRYQLTDSGARVVVADAEGAVATNDVRAEDLEHVVNVDATALDELPAKQAPPVELGASDVMAIVYTSGTTGMPKGCMLPHGYHTDASSATEGLLEYRRGDVLYTCLPLFHGWARGMLFGALVHGMVLHLDAEFSAATVLERLAATGATVFSGVGAMGMAMLARPASPADRAHRLRVAFMIPFPPEAERAFTERFGVRVQSQMYGQTETGAIAFTPLAQAGKPGTMGRPSPAYEVRVVDDEDREVPPGHPGEVVVRPRRPDATYLGYWRKPEATDEAWRGGWHHTGDLAHLDEDGYLVFVDRKSDAIRRRGENVSSVQLEAAITAHPKVVEAAVVAVGSEMTESDIKAYVVAEGELSPQELFDFFRAKLPYFAVPRYVEVVEELPKTATQRTQKHVLRERGLTEQTWDLERLGLSVPKPDRRS